MMDIKRPTCLLLAAVLMSCASGASIGPAKRWSNEVDPKAYYPKDDYECQQIVEAKHKDDTPAPAYGGAVAGILSGLPAVVAKHTEHDQCMSARGWKLITPVPVDVSSTPDDCEIWSDGVFVATTPKRGNLSPGPHEVEVRKKGFVSESKRFVLQAGTPIKLHFDLKAEAQ